MYFTSRQDQCSVTIVVMNAFCFYVALPLYLHNADSFNATGCYGSHQLLNLSCSSHEVIALDNIWANAKNKSTNCPTGGAVALPPKDSCCKTNAQDCKMDYTGASVPEYHKACSGFSTCEKESSWQDTNEVCGSDFLSPSNYMDIEYHCIATSGIVHIPSHNMTNGSTVSIQNVGYPTSGPLGSAGMCSITASHSSTIAVSLLHLDFTRDEDNTCQQYIDILDASSCERIDCGNNTNYNSGTIYTSRNHFISLNWTNQHTNSGRLWIQFTATNYQANLELRCGSSATVEEPGVSTFPGVMSLAEAAGTGIGVVVCVMLLLTMMYVLYSKKHQLMKIANHGGDGPDSEFADALGVTGTDMSNTAPASVSPPKPRRLAPIEVPGTGSYMHL